VRFVATAARLRTIVACQIAMLGILLSALQVFVFRLVESHTLENMVVAVGLLFLVYPLHGARE
jgi:hypothetical protein